MRRLLAVLAAISVMLAATTYAFWRDLRSERARADALQARVTALESRQPLTPVPQPTQYSSPAPTVPATSLAQPPSDTSSAEPADDYDAYMARRRQLLKDPKYYEASRGVLKLQYAHSRDELIQVLGISAAKADELVDFWIFQQLRGETREPTTATTEQETLEQTKMLAQQEREDEEKLRAIAGDELYARYQEFRASRPSRSRAHQLRARLASSNDVLRDDQFEPLIGVLHAEQSRLQQELQDFVALSDPDAHASAQTQRKVQQQIQAFFKASNRRIHTSAGAILSPRQVAELDAILRMEFESLQAQSALHLMEEGAGAN